MDHQYLPNTEAQRKEMLKAMGLETIEDLFGCCIPEAVRFKGDLDLPAPLSEMEALKLLSSLADKNTPATNRISFLGGGVADHYIPAAVDHMVSRSEFYTAYTPYQAEVSQGTLQNIFEFQSMICLLTEMEVANASMYDGGSALAEAAVMAASSSRRNKILISQTAHPEYRQVVSTYAWAQDLEVEEVAASNGQIDLEDLKKKVDSTTAAVLVQHPNFFGGLEPVEAIEEITHGQKKTLFVVAVDPHSLALLKPPGQYGADIVIGEGQPMGNPMSFGGPHLGFFAASSKQIRKMPGRIIGLTEDMEGQRGFVMTMQTREQHIRRQRATSNICTNQALNALAAAVYVSLMGKEGMVEVAQACIQKAHYLKERIAKLPGFDIPFSGPTFKEFVVKSHKPWSTVYHALLERNILAGIPLEQFYPQLKDHFLVCVTEKRTREELDQFLAGLEGL